MIDADRLAVRPSRPHVRLRRKESFDPADVFMVVDAMLCGEHVSHPPIDGVDLNIDRRAHELIHRSVDSDVDGERQCKWVQLSVTLRHFAVVDEVFMHEIKARYRNKLEDTPTNFAHGRLENDHIIALLHTIGGGLGTVNFGGTSPCMIAVMYRDAPILEMLLSLGANVNATNCAGVSAVWIAAFYGDLEILDILRHMLVPSL